MQKVLKGKVALITGSGQGIGKGLALYFAKLGAKIVTNNRHPHRTNSQVNLDVLSGAEKKKYLQMQGDAEQTAQEIIAAGGEGYYQEWGQPVKVLHLGDVVLVQPGVKHWHGATATHWFTCIGMILDQQKETEGLEKVDYQKILKDFEK